MRLNQPWWKLTWRQKLRAALRARALWQHFVVTESIENCPCHQCQSREIVVCDILDVPRPVHDELETMIPPAFPPQVRRFSEMLTNYKVPRAPGWLRHKEDPSDGNK